MLKVKLNAFISAEFLAKSSFGTEQNNNDNNGGNKKVNKGIF
jgi:hypothetical protein